MSKFTRGRAGKTPTVKIVLSRKGFDSGYGGVPSPIFPDGRAVSVPIPSRAPSPTRFGGVRSKYVDLGILVEQLTKGRISRNRYCHLDPDLDATSLPRANGWRPAFGQIGAAQSHLANQGVGPGDLFLFFGWFRSVEPDAAVGWHYRKAAASVHLLFGWLQIDEVLEIGSNIEAAHRNRPWLAKHPHLHGSWGHSNTVYAAAERLSVPGIDLTLPGGGCFTEARETLVLTDPESRNRSVWGLPGWFLADPEAPRLSYHGDPTRWSRRDDAVILRTVGQGQEFVIDVTGVNAAFDWLAHLFAA